ncbi:hypothetical protein [Pseudaminobacter soli (ex Li et al. 2025)]|uniref:Uncharacterized protein n=1 Tax=Pseudaminobacter soli (ex Li et al. 2025) TaxID=1295366 RepID=A0A2P7SE90_9HYPH|nr:hypothetical protein [Mesorhizobium soli]PSJ60783.1 hypothetical protein C7I85_12130 [Mesorhizobium soli]
MIEFEPDAAPVAKVNSKSEKPVNVTTMTADITDVATVEQQIEQHAQTVERIQREAIYEIGREFSAIQDLHRYRRGGEGFQEFVGRRFPTMPIRSIYQAVEVFKGLDPELCANFAHISISAQTEIAKAEPDIQAIIAERVEAGEVFTAAQVKEIKAKAAQEAITQINADAEQARGELAALKKQVDDKDIKSAAEVRDLQQNIADLSAKLKGYEEQVEKFQRSLPKPAKAKEQAAETGAVVLGSDGKFHSGSSAEQKRMHDAFMFAFDKALDLTENPPSPDRVIAGCPDGDRARLAELCVGAADYFIKIRAALHGK